jgi:hypothetical protein
MKAMSSGGERDAFYRLSAGMAPKLPTPRQPTALSSATDFFAKVGKIVKSPATALEKWGKAASNIVWEVSETLRVIDELIEYHGGEDQGADIYVLALAYLEQKPDAKLEDRLQRLIREYRGEARTAAPVESLGPPQAPHRQDRRGRTCSCGAQEDTTPWPRLFERGVRCSSGALRRDYRTIADRRDPVDTVQRGSVLASRRRCGPKDHESYQAGCKGKEGTSDGG